MNVTDWLLDSDLAIRWQVMRDLTDAPPPDIEAERARIALEGIDEGDLGFSFGEEVGAPSWWITLRALRVLRWFAPAA